MTDICHKTPRLGVLILGFNDFNSKWCLDELILEFKKQKATF